MQQKWRRKFQANFWFPLDDTRRWSGPFTCLTMENNYIKGQIDLSDSLQISKSLRDVLRSVFSDVRTDTVLFFTVTMTKEAKSQLTALFRQRRNKRDPPALDSLLVVWRRWNAGQSGGCIINMLMSTYFSRRFAGTVIDSSSAGVVYFGGTIDGFVTWSGMNVTQSGGGGGEEGGVFTCLVNVEWRSDRMDSGTGLSGRQKSSVLSAVRRRLI